MQKTGIDSFNEDNRSYICPKCNSSFEKFEEFHTHLKGFCKAEAGKKAFCIAFKGSDCTSSQKRINFTVDEYYYGHAVGNSKFKKRVVNKKFSCYSCGKVLRNNLRFMSHVRHKIENEWKENDSINDFNICNHCYRHYSSPFHLQCHIETVHATVPAATTCRICELNFENEQMFLMHMKDRHTYNEMPYVCKLCFYRSSFYQDLIQHFRFAHENCNSLLCPFCLSIHQTANSYLTHVIQHMNKSVRCTQCRLQFFTSKDKSLHLEADHKSVMKSTGKKNLPKNPNQYMIFVKVSHHPLSPTKSNQAVSKTPTSSKEPSSTSVKDGWSFSYYLDPQIPFDYRPYFRDANIYVILTYESLQFSSTKCIECGEVLGVFVANYNKHFQKEYSCQKCPFYTHCYKRIKKHILSRHVKSDCKPEEKTESSSRSESTPRGGSSGELVPASSRSGEEDKLTAAKTNRNRSTRASSRFQRSSSQTSDIVSPRSLSLSSSGSKYSVRDAQPGGGASGDEHDSSGSRSSSVVDSASTSAQKLSGKKRKFTDINSILLMKQQEQEQENERASKQRRKQSKPQKVELASAPEKSTDADGKYLESIRPPPLDAAVADYDDISADDELKEQARSSEPDKDGDSTKLPDQFASHLGLSKKKASPASSTPSHPFVNPRAAAFSSSHLWMEPTPFPVSSTLQPTSSTPSAMPPKPSKPGLSTVKKPKQDVPINKCTTSNPDARVPPPASTKNQAEAKTPCVSDMIERPTDLAFSEVTNSSFLVSWKRPVTTNITEYKLTFQGSGLPTTQRLPVEQTSVRLIGLRSNTLYLVQLCSVYRHVHSFNVEGVQRTLGLRENKEKKKVKVDEVIVLDDDDDDDDVIETTSLPPFSLAKPAVDNKTPSSGQKQTKKPLSGSQKRNLQLGSDGKKIAIASKAVALEASSSSNSKTTLTRIAFDPARGSIVPVGKPHSVKISSLSNSHLSATKQTASVLPSRSSPGSPPKPSPSLECSPKVNPIASIEKVVSLSSSSVVMLQQSEKAEEEAKTTTFSGNENRKETSEATQDNKIDCNSNEHQMKACETEEKDRNCNDKLTSHESDAITSNQKKTAIDQNDEIAVVDPNEEVNSKKELKKQECGSESETSNSYEKLPETSLNSACSTENPVRLAAESHDSDEDSEEIVLGDKNVGNSLEVVVDVHCSSRVNGSHSSLDGSSNAAKTNGFDPVLKKSQTDSPTKMKNQTDSNQENVDPKQTTSFSVTSNKQNLLKTGQTQAARADSDEFQVCNALSNGDEVHNSTASTSPPPANDSVLSPVSNSEMNSDTCVDPSSSIEELRNDVTSPSKPKAATDPVAISNADCGTNSSAGASETMSIQDLDNILSFLEE